MRISSIWQDRIPDRDKVPCVAWCVCFRPDGSQILVGASSKVLIYDAVDGTLVQSLKGHKDAVLSIAYSKQGKKFATGGADKQVIIWTSKAEGVLKYSHSDPVLVLAYNPVTQVLASGTSSDIGIWSPEQKAVNKVRMASKVLAISWSPDGVHMAIGLFNGIVSIRDKNGNEKVLLNQKVSPVYALAWNPQISQDCLVICCWDQSLSFVRSSGLTYLPDIKLDFDPTSVSFFSSGEYFLVSGSSCKAKIFTKEAVSIGEPFEGSSEWIWSVAVRPDHTSFATVSNSGCVSMHNILFSIVHALFKDRYAFRENATDVVVQNLVNDQKVRIPCKAQIRKLAIYKEKLAVLLHDKILTFDSGEQTPGSEIAYKPLDTVQRQNQKIDCSLLVVTALNLILCMDKRLQLLSFNGSLEREWSFDALVRYIKVIGGPAGREALLVALKNGSVLKVFVDNAFPLVVLRHSHPIRCVDININGTLIALVDDNGMLSIIDVSSSRQQTIFTEENASSVAWNFDVPDMLAYSGTGVLSIRCGNFPSVSQTLSGFVVGFSGSKVFMLQHSSMKTVDIPQSATMYKYIAQKELSKAYRVSCLGVTLEDWRALGSVCLESLQLDLAAKVFIRLRDIKNLELVQFLKKLPDRSPSGVLLGYVLAYRGKFMDAAARWEENGRFDLVVEMFTDLQMWEEAKKFAAKFAESEDSKENIILEDSGNKKVPRSVETEKVLLKEAAVQEEDGALLSAGETYLKSGRLRNALQVFIRIPRLDKVLEVVRILSSGEKELLQMAGDFFLLHKNFDFARETLVKLGNMHDLIRVLAENGRWEEALTFCKEDPDSLDWLYCTWAESLISSRDYVGALDKYFKATKSDRAHWLLDSLVDTLVSQEKFADAARWLTRGRKLWSEYAKNYSKRQNELFYALSFIEHVTNHPASAVVNACVHIFWLWKESGCVPFKMTHVLQCLFRAANSVNAKALALDSLRQLSNLWVTRENFLDVSREALSIMGTADKNIDICVLCPKCASTCAIRLTGSSSCDKCKEPFRRCRLTFEVLPLVEFIVDDVTHAQFLEVVGKKAGGIGGRKDLFVDAMVSSVKHETESHIPVRISRSVLERLDEDEVFIIKETSGDTVPKYLRLMVPEVSVSSCDFCGSLFDSAALDIWNLRHRLYSKSKCPFCHEEIAN